jgi:ring-1,2-phenylacetyl-CoA epoxidase subunit PaaD
VVATAPTRDATVWAALAEIADPEIPAISLVDLGVIRGFTFSPLPGRRERLRGMADEVSVELTFAEPWTSDRITPAGREALRSSGFAPPVHIGSTFTGDSLTVLPIATCPYCGSRNTTLENPFGPTLCRAIYHCADCRQPFEAFKPV